MMRGQDARLPLVLMAALGLGAGCAAAARSSAGPSVQVDAAADDPAGGGRGGSSGPGAAGSTGSPGSGSGGTGGGSGARDGGAGTGDASDASSTGTRADAGASGDAGSSVADAGPPPCRVTITPVTPARLTDLAYGPTAQLRVRGEVTGSAVTGKIDWTWTVRHEDVTNIPFTSDGLATITFPLNLPGQYIIRCQVTPTCTAEVIASAVPRNERTTNFWVRVIPPEGAASVSQEMIVPVAAGRPQTRDLIIEPPTAVYIEPQSSTGIAVSSYVRVTSPQSTLRVEGYNRNDRLLVQLASTIPYDILIVPDVGYAPIVYLGAFASQIQALRFTLDQGTLVEGDLSGPAAAIQGARILLRDGPLPSTLGLSDADGHFSLRVRSGNFSTVVLPPTGTSWPEAHIDGPIFIPDPPPPSLAIGFKWKAPSTTRLDLIVHGSDNAAPGKAVRVRLESDADDLTDVGTLTVSPGAPMTAPGTVRVEGATNAGGLVTFNNLPHARYHATLIPGNDLPTTAVTTVPVDASGSGPNLQFTVRLAAKVKVTGRLTPAALAVGATVIAIDTGADLLTELSSTVVAADGRFEFTGDPGRVYRLFVEGDAGRSLPRAPLGPVTVLDRDMVLDPQELPAGLVMTGAVLRDGQRVGGAVIQAFCMGDSPDCVDTVGRRTAGARPIAEAVSAAGGTFRLILPDPGTGN